MRMVASFKKQFEAETLQSEKLRAAILAAFALFTCIYIIFINFLIENDMKIGNRAFNLPVPLLSFLLFFFFYEFSANRILNRRLKRASPSYASFKYMNAFIEMSIITVMLYVYSVHYKDASLQPDIILVSLYYVIVFLSAFYLDGLISLVIGMTAAVAYTSLHLLRTDTPPPTSLAGEIIANQYFVYATGILLFISGIAAAFMSNQLKKGIQRTVELVEEEHRMFNLFSRQISKEIAQEILDKDGLMPSQSRFVTVMFIDIRDFTTYAENKEPVDIVTFQNAYFGLITTIVHKYEGIVNQFLGDGCMVTFGAPVKVLNSSENAIRAALEIKVAIEQKISRNEMHQFRIGVGIHCGNAVTGNIGTELKSEYSITGGVVILAARIESVNKILGTQILASKEVIDHANIKDLDKESMGVSHLKGWSHEIELYKLG